MFLIWFDVSVGLVLMFFVFFLAVGSGNGVNVDRSHLREV